MKEVLALVFLSLPSRVNNISTVHNTFIAEHSATLNPPELAPYIDVHKCNRIFYMFYFALVEVSLTA